MFWSFDKSYLDVRAEIEFQKKFTWMSVSCILHYLALGQSGVWEFFEQNYWSNVCKNCLARYPLVWIWFCSLNCTHYFNFIWLSLYSWLIKNCKLLCRTTTTSRYTYSKGCRQHLTKDQRTRSRAHWKRSSHRQKQPNCTIKIHEQNMRESL